MFRTFFKTRISSVYLLVLTLLTQIIRLLRTNEAIFLSSISLLLGYSGTFSLSQKSKDMFT